MCIQSMRCTIPCRYDAREKQTLGSCIVRSVVVALGIIALLVGILALSGVPGINALGTTAGRLFIVGAFIPILAGLFIWKRAESEEEVVKNILNHANAEDPRSSYLVFYQESQKFKKQVQYLQNEKQPLRRVGHESLLLESTEKLLEMMRNPPPVVPTNFFSYFHVKTFGNKSLSPLLDQIVASMKYRSSDTRSEAQEKALHDACEAALLIIEQYKLEEFLA